MGRLRPAVLGADAATAAVGAALTLLTAVWSTRAGGTLTLGILLGLCTFLLVLVGYIVVPHVAVALTIPYFAALPTLKVLVSPQLGATKDVVTIAAALGAGVLLVQRRGARLGWRADRPLIVLVLLLIGLYVLDIGAGVTGGSRFGPGWFHGVRLVSEPLLLLLVGLSLDDPRRTFRWAVASLTATACGAALYGLLQQVLGGARLVDLGYAYGAQVRTIGPYLRSFGTFDEPFDYAAFLLFGIAAVLLWRNRGLFVALALGLLAFGLLVSFVRTALLIGLALIGLWLARQGRTATAVLLLAAALFGGVATLIASSGGTETRTFQGSSSTYLTVNGRTQSWKVALGDSSDWAFGRGVGVVGTAAERARVGVSQTRLAPNQPNLAAVDSGYFATIADVGFVGLIVQLSLLGRLIVLARGATARRQQAGWVVLGLLAVVLLDAVTRASFTGFPTAFLGMLVVGVGLAATAPERPALPPRAEHEPSPTAA